MGLTARTHPGVIGRVISEAELVGHELGELGIVRVAGRSPQLVVEALGVSEPPVRDHTGVEETRTLQFPLHRAPRVDDVHLPDSHREVVQHKLDDVAVLVCRRTWEEAGKW